jgi:hypothetical protein
MTDTWILDIIEDSQRGDPRCAACSAPVIPAEHNGSIWLECATFDESKSRLKRLTSWGHTRRLLIAADQLAA